MKRDNIFWGAALILFGGLLFLQQQGLITNVFRFFWPLALILLGGWLVLGVLVKPTPGSVENFSLPLGGAQQVRYRFATGAAQVRITGGAPAGQAIVGAVGAGMEYASRSDGDSLDVKVDSGPSFIPFLGPTEGVWAYQLTEAVPVSITVEAGASTFELDLQHVAASLLELKVGASTVQVTAPARGVSRIQIEGGAASFDLRIPPGTAARVDSVEGLTSLHVDTARFPQTDSGLYQSPDYETAPNRTAITIRAGVGSVNIQ